MAGGSNPFVYAEGNPVNYIDPEGLNPLCIPFGRGIPGLDAEGRAFEKAATNVGKKIVTVTEKVYDKCLYCIVTCTFSTTLPIVATGETIRQIVKRASKDLAAKALKKAIAVPHVAVPIMVGDFMMTADCVWKYQSKR